MSIEKNKSETFEDTPSYMEKSLIELKQNGYSVVPNFLSRQICNDIINYQDGLSREQPDIRGVRYINHDDYTNVSFDAFDVTKAASMVGIHHETALEPLNCFYKMENLRNLSTKYLSAESVFGSRIQLVETRRTPASLNVIPFVVHYDRVRFLKFYLYLQDTTEKDGAFLISNVNQVRHVEKERCKQKQLGLKWNELSGKMAQNFSGSFEPIIGDAGTLIVFDSSQPHRHGEIENNNTRKVIMIECQINEEVAFGYNELLASKLDGHYGTINKFYEKIRRFF